MNKPIDVLNNMYTVCDQTSMLVMDTTAFEKFFGNIYAALKLFKTQEKTQPEAEQIVRLACLLLERAVEHHKKDNIFATESAAKVFEETVKKLQEILSFDLGIHDWVYNEARKTRLNLNALKATGIQPPGHREIYCSLGFLEPNEEKELKKAEALRYACENIIEFTNFAYNLGKSSEYIQDPFDMHPRSAYLSLYERVSSLASHVQTLACGNRLNHL